MLVGIIGKGVVGSAVGYGMQRLGHVVKYHDIALATILEDVLDTHVCYICVPTPNHRGRCDTSAVLDIIHRLHTMQYAGVVAIKSTVIPGTTAALQVLYFGDRLCFVPEFLRERHAVSDFIENNQLLAIGTTSEATVNVIQESHGTYPQSTHIMLPLEAELLKYFHNALNALRVGIANEFYDICGQTGADYATVQRGLLASTGVPDAYMQVNSECRGWSSICFNKDIPALSQYIQDVGLQLPILQSIMPSNARLPKTPFAGTRE